MRLATVRHEGSTRAARVVGEELVLLDAADVGDLLGRVDPASIAGQTGTAERLELFPNHLAPLVPNPSKIICLGLNYMDHIRELGAEIPTYPTLFAKFARTLVGPRDQILLPTESSRVDWEVELAFVIGRTVRRADREEAADAIAGFTVVNDISMRDWQRRTSQWLQGKAFEGSTPVGPWLVSPDELDGAADLALRCEVDGEVVQEGRTSNLVFKPEEVVSYVSSVLTLDPGDLISTGTPAGVGDGRSPPCYLKEGQILRSSIEGIGELVNECVSDPTGR